MQSQHRLALLCAFACVLQLAAAVAFPAGQMPHPAQPIKPLHPQPVQAVAVQHTDDAFFERCNQGSDWIHYKDSCYRYYETNQYWYLAELQCRQLGGHLVSIANERENSFVAKLTYCQSAWTGRFAVNVDKLNEHGNYRWTDGSNSGQYHAHDFTSIGSIHEPLISVNNLKWRNNVYHTKDKYVCEVKVQHRNLTSACEPGWKHLNGSCYRMPQETATFIEATFYCSGRDANLVSVHSQQELRALSLLDLDSNGCPPEVWIGLIKVNPCRIDFVTGKKICYKWADRSKDFYDGFPDWHPGHPDTGEQVNCVIVQDRAMKTVQCYERHRFICKKSAGV